MSTQQPEPRVAARHTNARRPLARTDRLTPDDFALGVESRAFWLDILSDKRLMELVAASPISWIIYRLRRKDDRSDPLELTARLVVWLAHFELPEAAVRRIPMWINRVIDDCYAGGTRRTLAELDRAELALEQRENTLQLDRHIDGAATAEELETEACAIEAEAALETERARELRRQARLLRAGLSITKKPGAAT